MRIAWGVLIAGAVFAAGCSGSKRHQDTTGSSNPQQGGNTVLPGGGGAIMGAHSPADRLRAGNDLQQIALIYMTEGNAPPPNLEQFLAQNRELPPKMVADLRAGSYVVYWNVHIGSLPAPSSTILAYERETPTQGGMVVMADTRTVRMTAQEFAAAAKAGQ